MHRQMDGPIYEGPAKKRGTCLRAEQFYSKLGPSKLRLQLHAAGTSLAYLSNVLGYKPFFVNYCLHVLTTT